MAFIVIAHDGRDAEALSRRLAARPAHFERVASLAAAGQLMMGGAILDAPDGQMTGSVVLLDLPDEAAVREWLAADPYTRDGVWQEVTILPFRLAPLPYRALPGAAG